MSIKYTKAEVRGFNLPCLVKGNGNDPDVYFVSEDRHDEFKVHVFDLVDKVSVIITKNDLNNLYEPLSKGDKFEFIND